MKNLKIAWIEDDVDVIYSVVRPLVRKGAVIKTYETYSDVIDHISEISKCDLVLLDVILPPGRIHNDAGKYLGLDLLRKMRREFQFKMPILLFSVVANARDVISSQELKELNVHTVSKPIAPSELEAEVMDILNINTE